MSSITVGPLVESTTDASTAFGATILSGSWGGASSCSPLMYIDFEDKELLAAVMTANINSKTVSIRLKTGQPSHYLDPHGSTTCRLVGISW